jgi:hypothetical protein
MIRRMSRKVVLLAAAAWLGTSLPALADEKKPRKDDEDVVIDNRGLAKEKAAAEEKKEQEMFENDTPFATTKPDPEANRAQRWKPGFRGAGRLGFGLPMGDYSRSAKFSKAVDGLIFVGGEFGYWFSPMFSVGLDLSGGYVLPDCSDQASCSGWQVRGGPLVMFRAMPHANFTPFFAAGAGYEWLTRSASTDAASVRVSAHGFEYVNLQAGMEFRKGGDLYGMFVSYSMGKYTSESLSIESDTLGDSDDSRDIEDPKIHGWLGIGARVAIE